MSKYVKDYQLHSDSLEQLLTKYVPWRYGNTEEAQNNCIVISCSGFLHIVYDSLREIAGQLKIDFQKLILGKVLIFMKFFENVFCYFRYSLNLVFWFFFTNLPISRNKCLSRFLYKHKNGIFRKPSHRILMLCKDKMYIILIEKLLLLRI